MKRDRRQINERWTMTNPLGERYEFGRKGSGKNAVIVTLAYLGRAQSQAIRENKE